MDQSIITIKCPNCGAVLQVKNQPDIETKNVPCPKCRQRMPFTSFQRVVLRKKVNKTLYPEGFRNRQPNILGRQQPVGNPAPPAVAGRLRMQATGQLFQLHEGRNIIGRMAPESQATIQIPIAASKRMSREHLVIEVKQVPGKGYMHTASLYKPKHNRTMLGGQELEYGQTVALSNGCIVELPDATLVFEQ